MKLQAIIIYTFVWGFGFYAQAQSFVSGVRSNQVYVEQISKQTGLVTLMKQSEEFANGNTFVRLKSDMKGASLNLYLPQKLSANDLMEALLTVFTAKKMGATEVQVILENQEKIQVRGSRGEVLSLQLEKWFKAAGADIWAQGAESRPLYRFSQVKSIKPQRDLVFS